MLAVIAKNGKPMHSSEIAKAVGQRLASAVALLDIMVRRGNLVRKVGPNTYDLLRNAPTSIPRAQVKYSQVMPPGSPRPHEIALVDDQQAFICKHCERLCEEQRDFLYFKCKA